MAISQTTNSFKAQSPSAQKFLSKKKKAKLNTAATKLFFPGQQNMGRTLSKEAKSTQMVGSPKRK